MSDAPNAEDMMRRKFFRPEPLVTLSGLTADKVDVQDTAALASQLAGLDAVVSAFGGHADADIQGCYLRGLQSIIAAVKAAGVPRLLVVGGAGSLEVAPDLQVVDTPDFPAQWKPSALGAREGLNLLRQEREQNWTMLSPSAYISPGERTAKFRLGTDQLLVGADGRSAISVEDFAVAMIDELEQPDHPRARFTVGY